MSELKMSELADDGAKWAAAFCERHPEIDEGTMIGWFCNAIEVAHDTRTDRNKFSIEIAMGLAAQCWCDPRTSNREMDSELATVFAELLIKVIERDPITMDMIEDWDK